MPSIKVSISLSAEAVAYLDTETLSGRYDSRSAAVQEAIRLLQESRLADAYAEAFGEWTDEWESTASDGVGAA